LSITKEKAPQAEGNDWRYRAATDQIVPHRAQSTSDQVNPTTANKAS